MDRVVYDSAVGRVDRCPRCGKRLARCSCSRPAEPLRSASSAPRDGVVRLHRDRKSRGGKVVTVITGLPGGQDDIERQATDLKRLCGTGGAVKGDVIEIQGDHRERIADLLRARGLTVKLAGG